MRKSIKLLVACMLCSPVAIVAQEQDSLFARKSKVAIEYGRGISFNLKESTTATAVASEEELSHKKSINNSNMLYGLIPGLQVLQNSGNAWDDAATLRVRGYGTSSSTTPLVLVDGFERSLDQISADEIESVTVLKDAASTALYGMKGANGVILVKTKRGRMGKPEINFSYQFNMATPQRLPEFVDGYTYAKALNEGLTNDGLSARYSAKELEAFRTYAELFPDNCLLLVDTYDTLKSGVPNAIRVFEEMRNAGIPLKNYGIRLDSGDLAYMSKQARKLLDAAGFDDAYISASSDLDEYLIESLKAQGCKITSWGVGTNMITSKDCPAFGGVYKLAAVEDKETGEFIPKIKLSENTEKITNPGNKTIYRIYSKTTGKIRADLICLADETFDESKDMIIFDPQETWKKTKVRANTYTLRELLVPVFKNGECVYDSPSVMKIRDYSKKELDTIWDETKRFANPQHVYVDLSDKLYKIKSDLLEKMSLEALEY